MSQCTLINLLHFSVLHCFLFSLACYLQLLNPLEFLFSLTKNRQWAALIDFNLEAQTPARVKVRKNLNDQNSYRRKEKTFCKFCMYFLVVPVHIDELISVSTHHGKATSRIPWPAAGRRGNEGQRPPGAGCQGWPGYGGIQGEAERRSGGGQRKRGRRMRGKERRKEMMKMTKRGAHWRSLRLWWRRGEK